MRKFLICLFTALSTIGMILASGDLSNTSITGIILFVTSYSIAFALLQDTPKYVESLTEIEFKGLEIRIWRQESEDPDFAQTRREIIKILEESEPPFKIGHQGICDILIEKLSRINAVQAKWQNNYNPGNALVIYKNWP